MTSTHAPTQICQPVAKWLGGKRQLTNPILAGRPRDIDSYCEPFSGMAAIFLALDVAAARCTLGDAAPDVVALHRSVRDHPETLVAALHDISLCGTDRNAFLSVRSLTPTTQAEQAARFLYLLTHGFRGLYRVNGAGRYNVAWDNSSERRAVLDLADGIETAHRRLVGATVCFGGFEAVLAHHLDRHPTGIRWVYLDPPYTETFSQYTAEGFNRAQHEHLAATVSALTRHGVSVMLSNSDHPATIEIYGDHLKLFRVQVTHASGAGGSRNKTELLGVNYPVADMADAETFLRYATPM